MHLYIREQNTSDISLFNECLSNQEFLSYIYGHKTITTKEFLERNSSYDSYVIGKYERINSPLGFCIFKQGVKDYVRRKDYFISGGIHPSLFNTGIGIHLCVAMILFFFSIHADSYLYAEVFTKNKRSLKMLQAVGFSMIQTNWEYLTLRTDKNDFCASNLVQKLSKQFVCEIIEQEHKVTYL